MTRMEKPNSKLPVYPHPDGVHWMLSTTQSIFAWKAEGEDIFAEPPEICPLCGNRQGRWIDTEEYGVIRCLCRIQTYHASLIKSLAPYRCPTNETKTIDNFNVTIKNNADATDRLTKLLVAARRFIEWPKRWILIGGNPGSGKTHILQSIANVWREYALYITDPFFTSQVFVNLKNGETEEFMEAVKHAPILVYDDLGSGHASSFPLDQLNAIIDFRYNQPKEYLTVVSTNLTKQELYARGARVADRLLDVDTSDYFSLTGVPSWRSGR